MPTSSSFPTNTFSNVETAPIKRDRIFRVVLLASMTIVIILLLHLTATTSLSRSTIRPFSSSSLTLPTNTNCDPTSITTTSTTLNDTYLEQITANNRNLVYLHPPVNALFMTMAKSGTSTTWHWLYPGITATARWNISNCNTYVHDMRSPCWTSFASYVYKLPPSKQRQVLLSSTDSILRVAIQRSPYDRIVSSFKSKFTCDADAFSTDVHNRRTMVPLLRRRARLPTPPLNSPFRECMNISEFALALDQCRKRSDFNLSELDAHVRPQEFFFDVINYDMVIDVNDLSDSRVLKPIRDRLPHKDLILPAPKIRHASGNDMLTIPENTARLLYTYALESRPGSLKYLPGAEPTTTSLVHQTNP